MSSISPSSFLTSPRRSIFSSWTCTSRASVASTTGRYRPTTSHISVRTSADSNATPLSPTLSLSPVPPPFPPSSMAEPSLFSSTSMPPEARSRALATALRNLALSFAAGFNKARITNPVLHHILSAAPPPDPLPSSSSSSMFPPRDSDISSPTIYSRIVSGSSFVPQILPRKSLSTLTRPSLTISPTSALSVANDNDESTIAPAPDPSPPASKIQSDNGLPAGKHFVTISSGPAT
mmetsp:Transcript_12077/g.16147  ORF Transcript_12077/g.16147 Transcript_12077/m.16147 type:complete len:235 (+) Transcript_12077:869-1573(+)